MFDLGREAKELKETALDFFSKLGFQQFDKPSSLLDRLKGVEEKKEKEKSKARD